MTLGHSGAKITFFPHNLVGKRGGSMNLMEQARLCERLNGVAPRIYSISVDSYIMERLNDLNPQDGSYFELVDRIRKLLEEHVWNMPVPEVDLKWQIKACHWLHSNAPWIPTSLFSSLHNGPLQYSMTHGDPTFANVMIRPATGSLVLIDPAPPRPGIPWLRYVDVGKLLQSAAGWEHVLEPVWPKPPIELIDFILSKEPSDEHGLCLFWAAFHCARVAARTTIPEARSWGTSMSKMFIERTEDAIRF